MQDTSWKDFGSVLEYLGASSEPFLETFWRSFFGQSDWGTSQQNFTFFATQEVLERVLAFGWPLVKLLGGIWKHFWLFRVVFLQFFLLFGVGFLEVFQKAIVVVALCTFTRT